MSGCGTVVAYAVKNVVIDKTVSVPDEYEFVTGGLLRSTILFYYM